MEVKKHILTIVRRQFPGSSIEWRKRARGDRVGGRVVWSGFRGMDQLDRQQTLYDALGELESDERQQVGTIFALTPDELIAAEENAMENR